MYILCSDFNLFYSNTDTGAAGIGSGKERQAWIVECMQSHLIQTRKHLEGSSLGVVHKSLSFAMPSMLSLKSEQTHTLLQSTFIAVMEESCIAELAEH